MDTIFALATVQGKAGVAVVRISGPAAKPALASFGCAVPPARVASLRMLRLGDGSVLDEALVLSFDAGHSFTGEEVVELHMHGSAAIVSAALGHLERVDDLRPAEAGEFTRRALENDRLDLAQVEGLADLIEAETEAQRRQAQRVFSGKLGTLADGWRSDLIRAASLLEVTIDFADEEVPTDVTGEVVVLIDQVMAGLEGEIAGTRAAERIRDGFEVAIVGPPNVGKSTLLNRLAGREAAITSSVAGTTRDVIEVRMDLAGLPVTILDTAGLRQTGDVVEAIGVERAQSRAAQADLRIFLGCTPDSFALVSQEPCDLVVGAMADVQPTGGLSVSGKTGAGIEDLIEAIAVVLGRQAATVGVATRARHRAAMVAAKDALLQARPGVLAGPDMVEIAAEEMRTAIRALESIVGRIGVESLLGEIFSSFCIGK